MIRNSLLAVIVLLSSCQETSKLGDNSSSSSNLKEIVLKQIIMINPEDFDPDQWPVGEITLRSYDFREDTLTLEVSALTDSTEEFELVAYNWFLESVPPGADILLSFTPDTTMVDAVIHNLFFDLTPMKETYIEYYRRRQGIIILTLRQVYFPIQALLYYEFGGGD